MRSPSRGHQFQKIGRKGEVRYGYAALAVIDTGTARVDGGAEPQAIARRGGVAAADHPDRRRRGPSTLTV